MSEWKLIEKVDKNPRFIREFNSQNSSHPLIREYHEIYLGEF